MKINFHYQKVPQSSTSCATLAANKLFDLFQKKYTDIEFTYCNYFFDHSLDPDPLNSLIAISDKGKPITELSKFTCNRSAHAMMIIENPENRKYFLLSYVDKLMDIKSILFEMGGLVEVFACYGVHGNDDAYYTLGDIPYTPIGYFQGDKKAEDTAQELYKLNLPKIIPPKLYFRSHSTPYLFRKFLSDYDNRFDMRNGTISFEDHIKEMSKYSINIDINSVAEISHRTVDAFALGTALIRQKLTVQYHNKLIPDYHYAAVRSISPHLYGVEYALELADAYIERFEDLKKDPDYVHFLSVNGRKWYEENATIDAHANILLEVIDFNKLL